MFVGEGFAIAGDILVVVLISRRSFAMVEVAGRAHSGFARVRA
jgi:hypothetical protein